MNISATNKRAFKRGFGLGALIGLFVLLPVFALAGGLIA